MSFLTTMFLKSLVSVQVNLVSPLGSASIPTTWAPLSQQFSVDYFKFEVKFAFDRCGLQDLDSHHHQIVVDLTSHLSSILYLYLFCF